MKYIISICDDRMSMGTRLSMTDSSALSPGPAAPHAATSHNRPHKLAVHHKALAVHHKADGQPWCESVPRLCQGIAGQLASEHIQSNNVSKKSRALL
jgi:hypothetical protein